MFPRVPPPRGAGPAPWDVRPQRLRSRSPRPPGTEGAGAAGAAGLRAAGAGSGIPAPQSGAHLPRPLLGRGGNPMSTPSLAPLPSPQPGRPHAALAVLTPGTGRTKLCSSSGCPSRAGHPLSHPRDTPRLPRELGPAWVRTSGSSCIPPFRAAGPPPASPTWTGCSLRPPGRGSSRSYTGEGRIPRVGVFAPPPSWAPPGERSPGQRGAHFSLAACVSDAAALHLGDIPRLDDRQLLQGTTSRCRASRFGGGCLLWSRSWLGVCVCVCARVARRRLKHYFWNRRA